MTVLDVKLGAVATTLINKFGRDATFKTEDVTYNPQSGEGLRTEDASTVIKISPILGFDIDQIDGTVIRQGDARIFIASAGVVRIPVVNESVVIGSDRWMIIGTKPLHSGEEVAAYEFHIRK